MLAIVKRRSRDADFRKRPRGLKSPQGLAYAYFHGRIFEPAKKYLEQEALRRGQTRRMSQALALSEILLEHRIATLCPSHAGGACTCIHFKKSATNP
jgi:hypothetical protein